VPTNICVALIVARVARKDCVSKCWLLQGFPSTRAGALALQMSGVLCTHFLLLDAPDHVLLERYPGRRVDAVRRPTHPPGPPARAAYPPGESATHHPHPVNQLAATTHPSARVGARYDPAACPFAPVHQHVVYIPPPNHHVVALPLSSLTRAALHVTVTAMRAHGRPRLRRTVRCTM